MGLIFLLQYIFGAKISLDVGTTRLRNDIYFGRKVTIISENDIKCDIYFGRKNEKRNVTFISEEIAQ